MIKIGHQGSHDAAPPKPNRVATPQKSAKTGLIASPAPKINKASKVRLQPSTPAKTSTPVKSPDHKKPKEGASPLKDQVIEEADGPDDTEMDAVSTLDYDQSDALLLDSSLQLVIHVFFIYIYKMTVCCFWKPKLTETVGHWWFLSSTSLSHVGTQTQNQN